MRIAFVRHGYIWTPPVETRSPERDFDGTSPKIMWHAMWYFPVQPPETEITVPNSDGSELTIYPRTRGLWVNDVNLKPFTRVTICGQPGTILGIPVTERVGSRCWIAYDSQQIIHVFNCFGDRISLKARSDKTDWDEGTWLSSPVFDYFMPRSPVFDYYTPRRYPPDPLRERIFSYHRHYMDTAHRSVPTNDLVQLGRLSPNVKFYCKIFLLCAGGPCDDVFRTCLLPLLLPDWIWHCERRHFSYLLHSQKDDACNVV